MISRNSSVYLYLEIMRISGTIFHWSEGKLLVFRMTEEERSNSSDIFLPPSSLWICSIVWWIVGVEVSKEFFRFIFLWLCWRDHTQKEYHHHLHQQRHTGTFCFLYSPNPHFLNAFFLHLEFLKVWLLSMMKRKRIGIYHFFEFFT